MRIALIGLSTPLYDYGVEARRARSDLQSSPNPIIDSPFGLLLLYDEIWFLCRSLCPDNMRRLDFVRFLDEEGLLPDLSDLDPVGPRPAAGGDYEELVRAVKNPFLHYNDLANALHTTWDARLDHHTHQIRVGRNVVSGNALEPHAILFDPAVLERLGSSDVELLGNTFGQSLIEASTPAIAEADFAHVLVIDDVPNYPGQRGPYHPVITEARNDPISEDFRRWISDDLPARLRRLGRPAPALAGWMLDLGAVYLDETGWRTRGDGRAVRSRPRCCASPPASRRTLLRRRQLSSGCSLN